MATMLAILKIAMQYGNEGRIVYIAIAESVQERSEPVDRFGEHQAAGLQYPVCLT